MPSSATLVPDVQVALFTVSLISKPKAMLGKMIAQTLPERLNQVVYGASGGQDNDL